MDRRWLWCALWLPACAGSHGVDDVGPGPIAVEEAISFDVDIYVDEIGFLGRSREGSGRPSPGTLVLEPDGAFRLATREGFLENARFSIDDGALVLDSVAPPTWGTEPPCGATVGFDTIEGPTRDDDGDGAIDGFDLAFTGGDSRVISDAIAVQTTRGRLVGSPDTTAPQFRGGPSGVVLPLETLTVRASEWIADDRVIAEIDGRGIVLGGGADGVFAAEQREPLPLGATIRIADAIDLAGNVGTAELHTPPDAGLFEGFGGEGARMTTIGNATLEEDAITFVGDGIAILRLAIPDDARSLRIDGYGSLEVAVGYPDAAAVEEAEVDDRAGRWTTRVSLEGAGHEAIVQLRSRSWPQCGGALAPPSEVGVTSIVIE